MNLTQVFLDQLEREAVRTRRALENVPKGKDDWVPHTKSMPLLRLAGLVASMPSWVALIINQDQLELSPPAVRDSINSRQWTVLSRRSRSPCRMGGPPSRERPMTIC
jgi:hypothetical protein